MEQLAKDAAELALRLAAAPLEQLRHDAATLDAIEQVALRVLKEVSAARMGRAPAVGEIRGTWRAMVPTERH